MSNEIATPSLDAVSDEHIHSGYYPPTPSTCPFCLEANITKGFSEEERTSTWRFDNRSACAVGRNTLGHNLAYGVLDWKVTAWREAKTKS